MRSACEVDYPLDLHLRRSEENKPRYRWGDPFIREALNHGKLLHGKPSHRNLPHSEASHGRLAVATERATQVFPVRNRVVTESIERAECHWRNTEQFVDLPVSYQSNMFMAQLCLEIYLREMVGYRLALGFSHIAWLVVFFQDSLPRLFDQRFPLGPTDSENGLRVGPK